MLTPHQEEVLEKALAFLRNPHRQCFVLKGLAGTGKTTLLVELASRLPGAKVLAPTGKAAAVLRQKSGREVVTTHSAIYNFNGTFKDEETGKMMPAFVDKRLSDLELLARKPILLDECSMVGSKIGSDLMRTGALVIACGDPGQLPPVKDSQFFTDADAELTEIHRQALDSPIIRQAHAIRSGEGFTSDGPGFQVLDSTRGLDIASYDIILCWTNKTRLQQNKRARMLRGIEGEAILPGEPIMCLRNDYDHGVFNGEVYGLATKRLPGRTLFLDNGRIVPGVLVEGFDDEFPNIFTGEDDRVPFALAYAATAHKAQGSEWKRVLVYDEMPERSAERTRWLYTAVTRASEHVTVVRLER